MTRIDTDDTHEGWKAQKGIRNDSPAPAGTPSQRGKRKATQILKS